MELLVRWNLPNELFEPPPPSKKGAASALAADTASGGDKQATSVPPASSGNTLDALINGSGLQEGIAVITLLGGDQPRRIMLQVSAAL
jgi:hypothetical protein